MFFFTQSLNHRFDIDAIRVPYKDDALSNPPRHRKLNGKMQMGTANLHHPLGKVPADFIETNVASIHLDEDIERWSPEFGQLCRWTQASTRKDMSHGNAT